MVVEHEVIPFFTWLGQSLPGYLGIVAVAAGVGLFLFMLTATLRSGPRRATAATRELLASAVTDLRSTSLRRIWALSWLAIKEAIRRRAVVVFAVFVLVLLFAGWFLDPGGDSPARLYLSFVITATNYLMLLLALLISALSLPQEFKQKTLYTVVTKPVRAGEIVLGRIVGFSLIGSALLVVMGTVSYVFVLRGLSHTHDLDPAEIETLEQSLADRLAADGASGGVAGRTVPTLETDKVHNHRHELRIDAVDRSASREETGGLKSGGQARTSAEQGHWHDVTFETSRDDTGKPRVAVDVGGPEGRLVARVPIYGKLRFLNRAGEPDAKGVNVGDEWTYRSFIDGHTLAAAIWTFEGITEERFPAERFPKGLPLELNLDVFRTHKGQTDDPTEIPAVPGSIEIRNPETGVRSKPIPFSSKDFSTIVLDVPRKLENPRPDQQGPVYLDLFDDLTDKGKIEVYLRCEQGGQYFGAARADMYFHARDAYFTLNFIKGYIGIWVQMVVLIGIGVMFSTFLSGPIALMATTGTFIGGLFKEYMSNLGASQFMAKDALEQSGHDEVIGGGPAEAFIRLINQQNMVSEMEPGIQTQFAEVVDQVSGFLLWGISNVLPEFGTFSFSEYVADGFDVPGSLMLTCLVRAAAFLLPAVVAGYFFLKLREVAR